MISGVDLFCGVGGLTHGLIKSGISVTTGFDIDEDCRFAYEENNKANFSRADVSTLSGKDIKKHWQRGSTTLLAGCAPCQPFSTYSYASRKVKSDEKWELVTHFARLVSEAKPHLVTMENVPQLARHKVFDEFLESLNGYHVWFEVVECSQFGVPQTRKRLVLLASRIGPVELLKYPQSRTPTVKSAISNLPRLSAGEFDPNDTLHHACRLNSLNLKRIRFSRPGGTWRDWPEILRANCHKAISGETYPSVYGRMEWEAPAPTITTQCFGYGNGRFGHPEQDRAITLREAAMLQTFPKNYKFLPKGQKAVFHVMGRLIGNAVPVRLGYVIGKTFVAHAKKYKA